MIYFLKSLEKIDVVRIYEKGVVPSDLWGSKSQVEMQKLIHEVQRNAQVELQSIKERMQKEMEARLKDQVEAMRVELLNKFKFAFTQLHDYSKVMVPDLEIIEDVKEEIVVEVYSIILH